MTTVSKKAQAAISAQLDRGRPKKAAKKATKLFQNLVKKAAKKS